MLFKPQLADIRQRLAEMFLQGALVPAPHYDMGQVERSWVDFHVGEASKHAAGRAMELEGRSPPPRPLLCLTPCPHVTMPHTPIQTISPYYLTRNPQVPTAIISVCFARPF